MSRVGISLKISSVESINKLLMLNHLELIEDEFMLNYTALLKKAFLVSREQSIEDGLKVLIGDTYQKQKDNFFSQGGYSGAIEMNNATVDGIYSDERFNNKEVSSYLAKYYRANDIGYVYLIAGTHNGRTMYKIGKANDVQKRLKSFEVAIPFDIDLVFAIEVKSPLSIESLLHKQFKDNRRDGEWFDFNSDMLICAVITMVHLQCSCESFCNVWTNEQNNRNKLDNNSYIEYLEAMLDFNSIGFDKSKRRELING